MDIEELEDKFIQIRHVLDKVERNGITPHLREALLRCKELLTVVPRIIHIYQYELEDGTAQALTRKQKLLISRINRYLSESVAIAA